MSNVKIKANASGTADFTIEAPATDSALTLTLPSVAGELLTTTGDGSQLTGITSGLSEVDQWYLNADQTSNGTITSLTRSNKMGTGMSVTSGIFTFPSTGYWVITLHFSTYVGSQDNITADIMTTTDGTNYTAVARANCGNSAGDIDSTNINYLFDVTNTGTHKVYFNVNSVGGSSLVYGNATQILTSMMFTKVGAT